MLFRTLRLISRKKSTPPPPPPHQQAPKTLQERYPQHKIGKGSYAENLKILSWGEGASLTIGNYCSIAAGVTIFLGGEHRIDWVTTFPFNVLMEEAKNIAGHPKTKGDVFIGSDVWLGRECVITSGVIIGHGAVIGARSVVTKDVPPYAIVAGNPGKIIRYRFEKSTIENLLKIEWWNWSESKIKANVSLLLSNQIDDFINEHRAL